MSMEYFGLSESVLDNAAAATSFDLVEPTAESGVIFKERTDKEKKVYKTWSEPVTVVRCFAEDKQIKPKKLNGQEITVRSFYAQLRIGDASKLNKGRTAHGRFSIDFEAMKTGSDRSEWMNNKSVRAVQTLIEAAGVKLGPEGATPDILKAVFPAKLGDKVEGKSVIEGKRMKAVVTGSERSDGKGRQVQIDEFLSEV